MDGLTQIETQKWSRLLGHLDSLNTRLVDEIPMYSNSFTPELTEIFVKFRNDFKELTFRTRASMSTSSMDEVKDNFDFNSDNIYLALLSLGEGVKDMEREVGKKLNVLQTSSPEELAKKVWLEIGWAVGHITVNLNQEELPSRWQQELLDDAMEVAARAREPKPKPR